MITGLTLGKFAPLHKGHQFLIETALGEVDKLIIVVYNCPEATSLPLPLRASWIRNLYPEAEVIEARDGPADVGNTPEIKAKQENYILSLLKGRKITNFYSSEFYGEHMSAALNAVDRRVDVARAHFPVSGTKIRSNSYEYRAFLHPIVYRDLLVKVVFLGAPSTGKTTLAQSLAKKHKTLWVPEYGREYWEKHQVDRRLSPEQLLEIAQGHIESEDTILSNARDFLFVDTEAITTYLFSQYYHSRALPALEILANTAKNRYDLFFLCETDIPYHETWDRSGDMQRLEFQEKIKQELDRREIRYSAVRGSVEERMKSVEAKLMTTTNAAAFERYRLPTPKDSYFRQAP